MSQIIPNKKDSIKDYLLEIPYFFSQFVFVLFYLSISPILLDISLSINVSPKDLILIFTFFSIGGAIGQLTSILYSRTFRKLHIVLFAYALLFIVTIILGLSSFLIVFNILYFISGYLLGVIWIQSYKYIFSSKIKNKYKLTIIATSFFQVGAIVAPFLSTTIINNKLSWRYVYFIIGFFILLAAILYLIISRKRENKPKEERDEKVSFKYIFANKNKNIIFILTAILLIFYVISETIIAIWYQTFFRIEKMFDVSTAGAIASVFWIAMLVGRIIVITLLNKIKTSHILLILSIIAAISINFMIFSNIKITIFIATFFAGIGYSGIFPLLFSSGSMIYKKGRGLLLTILSVSDYIGMSLAPYLIKLFSKYNKLLTNSLPTFFMLILIIFFTINILYRKNHYQ